ncbi:hypothetical protein SDC9_30726 [bioreactor metagenome]|uniref:Sigma-70 family RNA polymerase sigma factor n=1 Tax=bioreactor metagenome TaxID=1076179 RepID=A0A644V0S0_9ZZZZ|nr:sigma-70 family RNA polymerase sigma factor [Macellibacteroides fermentans]
MEISWSKIKNKDEQEWRFLFREHAEFLYAYGMKFVRNHDLVKDTIQDLFVAIYEKRNTLMEPYSIRAYLCMGLRNRLINELKKEVPISLLDDNYSFDLFIDTTEEDEYDQLKKIETLMSKLTNRQREVIYLKYFKGLSNEEISIALGINKQSVANLLSEAIHQMKKDASYILFLLFVLRRFICI